MGEHSLLIAGIGFYFFPIKNCSRFYKCPVKVINILTQVSTPLQQLGFHVLFLILITSSPPPPSALGLGVSLADICSHVESMGQRLSLTAGVSSTYLSNPLRWGWQR